MQTVKDAQQLLLVIGNNYESFPQSFKRIADYILANHENAAYQSISEIASNAKVSEASITKFVKGLGFKGLSDFKLCLAKNTAAAVTDEVYGEIHLDDTLMDICTKVFHKNMESLKNTLRIIDIFAIEEIAERIISAKRIDFYGQGGSVLPAMNAVMRLQRINIRASYSADPHLQITSASLLEKGDIAIGISNSGRTKDTIAALSAAQKAGATTVCITSNDGSAITKVADSKLIVAYTHSQIIDDVIASRIAELSILDAVYLCIAGKTKRRALEGLYTTDKVLQTKRI